MLCPTWPTAGGLSLANILGSDRPPQTLCDRCSSANAATRHANDAPFRFRERSSFPARGSGHLQSVASTIPPGNRLPAPSHPIFFPTIGEQNACSSHTCAAVAATLPTKHTRAVLRQADAQQGTPYRPADRRAREASTVKTTTHSGPAANDLRGVP